MGVYSYYVTMYLQNTNKDELFCYFSSAYNLKPYNKGFWYVFSKRVVQPDIFVLNNKAVVRIENSAVSFELSFHNYNANTTFVYNCIKSIAKSDSCAFLMVGNTKVKASELTIQQYRILLTEAFAHKRDAFLKTHAELHKDVLPHRVY